MVTVMQQRLVPSTPKNYSGNGGSVRTLCPHCGGRLFLEYEFQGKRLLFSMGCINCAREYSFSGDPVHKERF